jgi:3-deoxy-7-phosphoheptulonate synthase
MPSTQQPRYADPLALERTIAALSRLPPLVVSWEVEALRDNLAKAQRGEQFVLQGGDCAESFEDCESDNIARRLKILLQMSLVLLQGLKKPVIRVGRFAGQYAKPRSADTETRDGVTLPCYRGDNVNRPGFTAAEREPDPELLLRGYERASLTLEFRPGADRRRICRFTSSGVLGLEFFASCAACATPTRRSSIPSPNRWISSNP